MPRADINHWETAIAEVRKDDVLIRGKLLSGLIGKVSFAEMAMLVLSGELPTAGQARVLEAIFVSVMEHGISPSSTVTRELASYGVPIQVGVAGGGLTVGDHHSGAGEQIAGMLHTAVIEVSSDGQWTEEGLREKARELVAESRRARTPIAGFGHPQHGADPRSPILLALAREEGVTGAHTLLLEAIERELEIALGRHLPVNVDGVIACLILDLGLDWRAARPIVMAPRSIGLGAHFIEELQQGNLWRHVPNEQVTYTGKPETPSGVV